MKHDNLSLFVGKMFFVVLFFLTTFTSLLATSESEVITTIILIDRQAELVDVDQFGEVLKRHVALPDYFSSGRSHNSILRNSLKKVKDYGLNNSDFSIPESSKLSSEELQSFLVRINEDTKGFDRQGFFNRVAKPEQICFEAAKQKFQGLYVFASLKEEEVKEEIIKRKKRETPFSYYTTSTANGKQRTRGQLRYYLDGVRFI